MVSQDEQGIRDLIKVSIKLQFENVAPVFSLDSQQFKVGCFRAAANLCGRLLTACGQGYGQIGQPSKHTPHTLQVTVLTMLVFLRLISYFCYYYCTVVVDTSDAFEEVQLG